MYSFSIYTEIIEKLTTELEKIKQEVDNLKQRNSNLSGKLEVYEKLTGSISLSSSKNQLLDGKDDSVDIPINKPIISLNEVSYDDLFKEYSITKDVSLVEKMFTINNNPTIILQDLRNQLPPNIDDLAKKFKFVKKLRLLRKIIEATNTWNKKDSFYSNMALSDIVDNYIICYNKEKKTTAFKYVRLALLYHIFSFDIFLSKIENYMYDNFDVKLKKIKTELFGNQISTPRKKIKKGKNKYNKKDYITKTIDELFAHIMNSPRRRECAIRVLKNMKKFGNRSVDEIETLYLEINEHMRKKIEKHEYN